MIVTTVVQSSSSTATSTPLRARSPSPLRMSRQQEKDELCSLNDRLAAIIERNRQLELENTRLTSQIHEFNGILYIDFATIGELSKRNSTSTMSMFVSSQRPPSAT